jgi:hypothetical protein
VSQHMDALKRADEIRLGRARVKQEITSGTKTVADALDLECCQSMRLAQLLGAQRRWGEWRVAELLKAARVDPLRTVGALTAPERKRLLATPAPLLGLPRSRRRPRPRPVERSWKGRICRLCGNPLKAGSDDGLCGFCREEGAA